MRLDDLNTDIRHTATVKESERITPDEADEIRNLVLEVDDGKFSFEAGQSIGVVVPGPHEFGQKEHFRLYTAANTHKQGDGTPRLEVCVKRCFAIDAISGERRRGVASGYLCDRQPGDQITITGPYGMTGTMQANAGFFACALNAKTAGDGFPTIPGPAIPIAGVTFTALTWIDKDTLRATFNPSPAGATNRIYLRQALPGPGVRRWAPIDGYIAEYSALNPNSTFDFTTKFQHLSGWHGRYWLGTQNTSGGRSVETLFDL